VVCCGLVWFGVVWFGVMGRHNLIHTFSKHICKIIGLQLPTNVVIKPNQVEGLGLVVITSVGFIF
jgi:hypothetical protein